MCLILFAVDRHPEYPIIFAANRDEFYGRPTLQADFWPDAPHILAGRDEEAGGTWCGVNLGGSFAAVTNYREPPTADRTYRSRGDLVASFLRDDPPPREFLQSVASEANQYRGFNLIVGGLGGVWYYSNREGEVRPVVQGVHGLSNHLLDTPWHKVVRGRERVSRLLERDDLSPDALFEILADEDQADDAVLPDTGFGRQWERVLSPSFIRTDEYGTRSSTFILIDREGNVELRERTFVRGEYTGQERVFVLPQDAPAAHTG